MDVNVTEQLHQIADEYKGKIPDEKLIQQLSMLNEQVKEAVGIKYHNNQEEEYYKIKPVSDFVNAALKRYIKTEEDNIQNFFPSGFHEVDDVINGFYRGELTVISGRREMGTETLMTQLAFNIAASEARVLYCSFSSSEEYIVSRMLSCQTGIDMSLISQFKKLKEEETLNLLNVSEIISKLPLYITSNLLPEVEEFLKQCSEQIEKIKPDIIFIENLYYIEDIYASSQDSSFLIHQLKIISKRFNIAVVVSSIPNHSAQIRKGDKRPILIDLRRGEQDADKVIFVYHPSYFVSSVNGDRDTLIDIVQLIIAKNNSGVSGFNCPLKYYKSLVRFYDFNGYITFEEKLQRLKDSIPIE